MGKACYTRFRDESRHEAASVNVDTGFQTTLDIRHKNNYVCGKIKLLALISESRHDRLQYADTWRHGYKYLYKEHHELKTTPS